MNVLTSVIVMWLGIVLVAWSIDQGPSIYREHKVNHPVKEEKKAEPKFDLNKMLSLGVARSRRERRIELGLFVIHPATPPKSRGAHRRAAI